MILLQQSACKLGIDQNLQRHRAVSLRQHGFLVIGNLLKLNADELKLRLIEAWFGIQKSVADQAIDQWRVCLACVKAKAF